MRRAAYAAGFSLLALPISASHSQVVRWNDRVPNEWTAEVPRVQLMLESAQSMAQTRTFGYGEPVRVRFRVDEDAYVVVGRVDTDGRLTILFPNSSSGRTFVRAGSETVARGRRAASNASFYAFDRFGGSFVFALASSSPLDLSGFQTQDFERIGLQSKFTYANHRYAYDADEYIQRFASWVLYDAATEFDYDVAYYTVGVGTSFASSLGLCFLGNQSLYDYNDRYGFSGYGFGYSLASACRNYYNTSIWCLGYSLYSGYAGCGLSYQPYIVRTGDPTLPDGGFTRPNKKGSGFGDDWKPETVVGKEGDWRTNGPKEEDAATRLSGDARRGDGEWDNIRSIPSRSLDELKRSERVKGSDNGSSRAGRFADEGGIRPPRETIERGAPSRDGKAARDRDDDAPRRFTGSSGSVRGGDAPAREPRRSGPVREGPNRDAGPPPRPASREPVMRSDPPRRTEPSTRSEPRSSTSIRSEPAKGSDGGSSGGGEKKKPPQN